MKIAINPFPLSGLPIFFKLLGGKEGQHGRAFLCKNSEVPKIPKQSLALLLNDPTGVGKLIVTVWEYSFIQ